MPTITYITKYRKNEGLILSAEEFISLYFFGIDLTAKDGTIISKEMLRTYLKTAQEEVEKHLGIRFTRKMVEHSVDYYADDHRGKFPLVQTRFQVEKPLSMVGFLGTNQQVVYPPSWLQSKKDSEGRHYRAFSLVPVGSSMGVVGTSDIMYTGLIAHLGLLGYTQVPDYFSVQYITGFKQIPYDVMNIVGKIASINVFNILGDIILGAGIASMSLGLDGLSQSISTTSSATNSGYGARITQYQKEIKIALDKLKKFYKGVNLTAL
jgi:hypothetical protein